MDRRMVAGRTAIGQDTLYAMKFSTDPSKIRWATELKTNAIGVTGNLKPYDSMYTYMTPDQYLDLTMQLENTKYDKDTVAFMAQGVVDKKEFGMPYLIIEIRDDGKIGKVVGQEGRHRAATAKNVNGPQSNMPVAIQFVTELSKFTGSEMDASWEAYKNNDKGRKDPIHKKMLTDFINDGLLMGMDRNVFRKVGEPASTRTIPSTTQMLNKLSLLYMNHSTKHQAAIFNSPINT